MRAPQSSTLSVHGRAAPPPNVPNVAVPFDSVTPEFFPLVKTGGLADVVGALPAAMAAEDIETRTLVPGYPDVLKALKSADTREGWLFCLPYLVLFAVFVIFPAVWGTWISLHRYDFTLPDKPFIGLDNYTGLITGSSPWSAVFWESLRNTLLFTLL